MKILVVSQYYYPESFRINDISETLVRIGHSVTVLTGLPNYPTGKIPTNYTWFRKRNEDINGVKVIRVPLIGRGSNKIKLVLNYLSFAISSIIKVLLMKKDYDYVFVYQLSPITMALPAIVYKKITGKKVLLYSLDLWPESVSIIGIKTNSVFYKILLRLSRFIYKNVDKILVTSESFISYFSEVIGIPVKKIEYLPQYAEDIYNKDLASKSLNNKNFNFVFAGNIGEWQSIETLIKAAAEIRDLTNVKWHIVGDGSAKRKCEKLADKLNLNNIIFYGQKPISEMPRLYSEADALLITLKKDTFVSKTLPGKLQSYMAAGKPIIGSINGEANRVINESKCGICCDAEDYITLAKNIRFFIENPQEHKRYSENARKYYEKEFSKEAFFTTLNKNLDEN